MLENALFLHAFGYICAQVCQKGSYMRTVSRHTFHHHLIATSIDQWYMCMMQQKVKQSPFTQASFPSLSDICEYSGDFQMAPSHLHK